MRCNNAESDRLEGLRLQSDCSLQLAKCQLELGQFAGCIEQCSSLLAKDAYEWETLAYRGQVVLRHCRTHRFVRFLHDLAESCSVSQQTHGNIMVLHWGGGT